MSYKVLENHLQNKQNVPTSNPIGMLDATSKRLSQNQCKNNEHMILHN